MRRPTNLTIAKYGLVTSVIGMVLLWSSLISSGSLPAEPHDGGWQYYYIGIVGFMGFLAGTALSWIPVQHVLTGRHLLAGGVVLYGLAIGRSFEYPVFFVAEDRLYPHLVLPAILIGLWGGRRFLLHLILLYAIIFLVFMFLVNSNYILMFGNENMSGTLCFYGQLMYSGLIRTIPKILPIAAISFLLSVFSSHVSANRDSIHGLTTGCSGTAPPSAEP